MIYEGGHGSDLPTRVPHFSRSLREVGLLLGLTEAKTCLPDQMERPYVSKTTRNGAPFTVVGLAAG